MSLYPNVRHRTFIDKSILEMTSDEIAELRDAFTSFDADGNGTICFHELETLMKSLNMNPTEAEIKDLMNDVDMDGNGTVDFYEFMDIMLRRQKRTDAEEDIIEAFRIFDRDRDGFVTAADLKIVLTNMATFLDDENYEDMIRDYDEDGDNKLNFEEFHAMMTS